MSSFLLKFKAWAFSTAVSLKAVLLTTAGGLLLTLINVTTPTAQAAGVRVETKSAMLPQPSSVSALDCYPVPQGGGGGPLDGLPPLSINPADWIGWVLGQLCKAVATVFFTLTNQVINWGSGCSQAGINFVTQTPNYIRLDASKADNWQLFFWDGSLIGAFLLLQLVWTALSIIWNRQSGNGYAGAQEAVTRTLLGSFALVVCGAMLDWSVAFCNLLNGLFASRLSLFDPKAFQVDANGNIFNTVLSMAAALASLLLVIQMATRYIYLALLQFIFPVGIILGINRGTQSYSRLLLSSFVATLFVQPLQLAAIYITSNMKDGTRDDTSLSMLFGICGLFLALGLPRVMGSVLGGGTPVGAWSIFAIGRMAAGSIGSAVRSGGSAARTGSRGGNPGGNNRNAGGGGSPASGGPAGGGSSGSGRTSSGSGGSGALSGATMGRSSQNVGGAGTGASAGGSNGSETPVGADESLRHGGLGQAAFRNTTTPGNNNRSGQPLQTPQSPVNSVGSTGTVEEKGEKEGPLNANPALLQPQTASANRGSNSNTLPGTDKANFDSHSSRQDSQPGLSSGDASGKGQMMFTGLSPNTSPSSISSGGPGEAGSSSASPPVSATVFRTRNGIIPRSSLGKNREGQDVSGSNPNHQISGANSSPTDQPISKPAPDGSNFVTSAQARGLADGPIAPAPKISQGRPPHGRRASSHNQTNRDLKGEGNNGDGL